LLAVLLTLSSLNAGLLVDDYHHKLLMSGSDSPAKLLRSPLDMFRFFDGDPQRTAELIDFGLLPWWTHPNIKGAFWRPLASATHWLDYILWPDCPPLMHAHSILWYAALVIAVTFLYRRFIWPAWLAGLAALLFAVDDAHGMPVGFLANRNALLATLFGVLTIIAHDRWRRDGWRPGIFLAPLLLAASLLSAEAGIGTCAFLAAHALFVDRDTWPRRALAMTPYLLLVIVWRITWTHLGYGFANIGGYVDPLAEPGRFISALIDRAPFLLLGQWALPASDMVNMLPSQLLFWLRLAALIFIVLLALLLLPVFRRHRTARFWAAAMLLSILPISAVFPCDRLLLFVGLAAMALLAQFFAFVFTRLPSKPLALLRRVPALLMALIFILCHLVLAPLLLPLRAGASLMPNEFVNQLQITTPLDSTTQNQDLVVVNPPTAFFVLASALQWAAEDLPMPRHFRILTSSLFGPVEVQRPDENTLVVRPQYGYNVWVLDRLFRNKKHPFSLGDRVTLTGMSVQITKLTPDRRPAEAAFTFDVPLEDASLRWLQSKDGAFVPFTPPAVGQTLTLPGHNPFQ
jgi:hypothetical protein